jgi:hypothetical protein
MVSIVNFPCLAAADGSGAPLHIATASSDGVVKVWDSRALSSSSSSGCLQELVQVSTNGRITGMVLSAPERKAAGAAAAVGAGGAAAAAANGQQVQVGSAAAQWVCRTKCVRWTDNLQRHGVSWLWVLHTSLTSMPPVA